MRPVLLRAPLRLAPVTRGLCGTEVVISSKPAYSWKRLAGLVGFLFLIAIALHPLEELDRLLALDQPDVGLLPLRTVALETSLTTLLALEAGDPDLAHLALELRLYRLLDLDLVGVQIDLERDDVGVAQ